MVDDRYAVVHSHMVLPRDERGTAVVDVWHVVDGLITEHWDVVQPVPQPGEVPNGMF